jgi:hypothetical protein
MAVTVRASHKGLDTVDHLRRNRGWAKNSTAWCEEALTSVATLKRFWRRLPIQQESFLRICQAVGVLDWQALVDNGSSANDQVIDFFAYDGCWVGRQELVKAFSQGLKGSCRLLILVGITGIGKTALAERLIFELDDWLQTDWNRVCRENFDYQDKAITFADVAVRWLESWKEVITPEQRSAPEYLLERLINKFKQERYLIVIDALEKILSGNEDIGWGAFNDMWWERFFKEVLSATSFQSRIILTSQDLPVKLVEIGSRYPNFWHRQLLDGLDVPEQEELFRKVGLVAPDDAQQQLLLRIGQAYRGHPLALRTICGEILSDDDFKGNILAYWKEYGKEIQEVELALQSATQPGGEDGSQDRWKLDRYSVDLRRLVRVRLESAFERLRKSIYPAYILLCVASVYRCPVRQNWWLKHLEYEGYDDEEQQIALQTLRDRFLVDEGFDENNCRLIGQHNLVRSVAIAHREQLDSNSA